LVAVSEHLFYELKMLHFTAREAANRQAETSELKNAVVESFAMHLRNLRDFFYKTSALKDEALARHYLGTWAPSGHAGKLDGELSRHIVHLSYKRPRLDEQPKEWPISALVKEIDDLLADFLAQVPESHLCPDLRRLKSEFSLGSRVGFVQSAVGTTTNAPFTTSSISTPLL